MLIPNGPEGPISYPKEETLSIRIINARIYHTAKKVSQIYDQGIEAVENLKFYQEGSWNIDKTTSNEELSLMEPNI